MYYFGSIGLMPGKWVAFELARKRAGLNQQQIADELDVDQAAVSKWQTGRSVPETRTLLRLAVLLACSLEELVQGLDSGYDALRVSRPPDTPPIPQPGEIQTHTGSKGDVTNAQPTQGTSSIYQNYQGSEPQRVLLQYISDAFQALTSIAATNRNAAATADDAIQRLSWITAEREQLIARKQAATTRTEPTRTPSRDRDHGRSVARQRRRSR